MVRLTVHSALGRLLIALSFALALTSCSAYSAKRLEETYDSNLRNVYESGYPTRLVVDLDDPAQEVARRERKEDRLSTLLVVTRHETLIEPGPRLRGVLPKSDIQALVERAKSRQAAGDFEGALDHLTKGYVKLVAAHEPRVLTDVPRPTPSHGHDRSHVVLAAIIGACLLVWGALRLAALRSESSRARLRALKGTLARVVLGPEAFGASAEAPLRPWLVLVGVLCVVAGVYASTLQAPFLWDDRRLILEQILESPRPLEDYVFTPFWNAAETGEAYRGFFRPLTTLSLVADAAWSGSNPVGYHLTNLALHLGVVATLFGVARRFGASTLPAAAVALGFGVAPRLTECVSWISGRTDVLAALFGLLAFLVHPFRCLPERSRQLTWLSALFLTLGMGAKEVAAAFVLTIVLDEIADARRHGRSLTSSLAALLPLALCLGVYVILRAKGLASAHDEPNERTLWPFLVLEAMGRYALMLVDWARPVTQIGFTQLRSWPLVTFGALVAVVLAILVVRGLVRALRPRPNTPGLAPEILGLWLSFFAIAPVLHVIPLAVNVVAADRFLYVPLAGLGIAGAVAWSRLGAGRRRRVGLYAAVLIAVSVAGTVVRNRDYETELAFWWDAVKTTRIENTLPVNELANVYYRERDTEMALGLYMRAFRELRGTDKLDRGRVKVLANLSSALSGEGRYNEALAVLELVRQWGYAQPADYLSLALLYLHLQDYERARAHAEAALERYPGYMAARQSLALIAKLEEERKRIQQLQGEERRAKVAELLARSGARKQAQELYGELLEGEDAERAEEAAGYLTLFGDPKALRLVAAQRPPSAPALQVALAERLAFLVEAEKNEALVRQYRVEFDPLELGL